jgi:quercetin dioxygenase-like cupin family protein
MPPVTLRAGDSLFVPAGTIHSHWNPSATEHLRFLEFIVAEKDKGRSIPQPLKN